MHQFINAQQFLNCLPNSLNGYRIMEVILDHIAFEASKGNLGGGYFLYILLLLHIPSIILCLSRIGRS